MTMIGDLLTLFGTLLAVILILFASFWCTRYIGKTASVRRQSSYMKIEDQLPLGQDKSLAIVRLGLNLYLVSISQEGVSILREVDEEDLIRLPAEPTALRAEEFIEKLKNMKRAEKKHE